MNRHAATASADLAPVAFDGAPSCVLTLEDGAEIDLARPDPNILDIARIARYLARLPRWLGHTDVFISVAQHSVWVAAQVPVEHRLQALLHDAPEAIIGDCPAPMKAHLPVFRAWEAALWRAICARYGVAETLADAVKVIDGRAQAVETRDHRLGAWGARSHDTIDLVRFPTTAAWPIAVAEQRFLDAYVLYGGCQ